MANLRRFQSAAKMPAYSGAITTQKIAWRQHPIAISEHER